MKIQRAETENVLSRVLNRPARSTIVIQIRPLRGDPRPLHSGMSQFGQKLNDRITSRADCSNPQYRFQAGTGFAGYNFSKRPPSSAA